MIVALLFVSVSLVYGQGAPLAFVTPVTRGSLNKNSLRNNEAKAGIGMIGGRGWDNGDYLTSLSGDEEDRAQSQEDYQEYSERRAAFQTRQEELLKNSPQAQAYMQQRQDQKRKQQQEEYEEDSMLFGGGISVPEGSGGGTRMGHMMAQAKQRMGGPQNQFSTIGGFQQQLLGPLDDDEEEGPPQY